MLKRPHLLLLLALLAALALVVAACAEDDVADEPEEDTDDEVIDDEDDEVDDDDADEAAGDVDAITVGALFPQSGDLAFGAADALEGVEVAVEMFNERGEHGIEVELVTADAPDPAGGTAGVRQLITQDDVDAVIGTYASAIASAAVPAAERLDTLYLETTAFAEAITDGPQNVLRTTISSGDLGSYAAEFILTGIAEEIDVAEDDMRVAVVYTDDEFGTSIADAALDRFADSGAELVVEESYPAATTSDLSSVLLQIQQTEPHAVVHVAQVPDGVLFWRQAQQLDVNMPAVVGAGGGYGQIEFAEPLGENADGIFNIVPPTSGSINVDSLSEEAQGLLADMQEKLDEKGYEQGNYTDWAFMGTWVFLNEVVPNAASADVDGFIDAAQGVAVDPLDSITGFGFEFAGPDADNAGQNILANPVVQQWQGGELVVTYPEELAVSEFVNVPLPDWDERDEEIQELEDEEEDE